MPPTTSPPGISPSPASLEETLAFLRSPLAYPDAPARVEVRETHMSWVFLTAAHAWKLKKPVVHAFLDYGSLDRRRHFCAEELRLNRRLAPQIYLGVVPLARRPDGRLQLGGTGPAVEWLVQMRRLPAGQMLDAALESGAAPAEAVERAARHLAAFYAAAPREHPTEAAYLHRFARELALGRESLHDGADGLPRGAAATLGALEAVLLGERELLLAPLRAGRIAEGHGDLRPEHVFLGHPPAVIDCIEFDRGLRLVDPFEELAFLAMECALIPGGAWAGRLVLEQCAAALGGLPPARLLAFYTALKAFLRARLSVAHLRDPAPREPARWRPRALRYLALAGSACVSLRHPPPAAP